MGATASKIAETAKAHGFEAVVFVDSMEEAIQYAADKAEDGDAVLLSPAVRKLGNVPEL